jgi:bifunctional non-homologous end joining protein LigD
MPDLKRYRARRDPQQTPEPFGSDTERRSLPPEAARVFVVQQHRARQLHWDLRLETDRVLASWAIPKGPSDDPREKRFAARTEDHPLEYAEFEGIIPEGNYGAGAMIVWDHGSYQTVDGRSPSEGLEAGKLDLLLQGHKLRGRFALVRMKGEDGRAWLLLRKGERPEEAAELTERLPASVLSGLSVEELRDGVTRDAAIEAQLRELGAPEWQQRLRELRPMLATAGEQIFSRDDWLFELKYDGARVLAQRRGDDVELRSRTGRDATSTYGEIARALRHLPIDDLVLDGEIVAFDERGRSSFARLQRRFSGDPDPRIEAEFPVVYQAFDLLAVRGRDLRDQPLRLRKRLLAQIVPALGRIRFTDHIEGDGESLYAAAQQHDLEGVMAKRAASRYRAGRRSDDWLKLKVARSADLLIVGYQPGRGSRRELGSLMLAWFEEGTLRYAGNVGSGLDETSIASLRERLDALQVDAPSCEGAGETRSRHAVWVRPELVCEVKYTEITRAGALRHPVFLRLREDKPPLECTAPRGHDEGRVASPVSPRVEDQQRFQPTNLDKIFWPLEGYTKGDLLAYHERIWPWLAPYLRDRPLVLTRYPDGIEGKSFYQKNAPDFTPDWVERETIEGTDYFICNELRSLLYVINSGAIPLHVWSARRDRLDTPDWLILDLDPKQASFADVVQVARHIHHLLESLGTPHFAKTSGQDGLHVLLPLDGSLAHEEAKLLAELLARVVVEELPDIATITRPVAARGEKVYVDYLQNGRGKLIAAPFSVRPRAAAPVSTPLRWPQVTTRLDPSRWNLRTTPREMARRGDPMAPLLQTATDVPALLEALGAHPGS